MEDAVVGMNTFLTNLQSTLTTDTLWGELGKVGAFLGLMIVFAFGYRVVRRLINGVSRGKANI